MTNTLKMNQQTELEEPIEYFMPYSLGFKFSYIEAQENYAENLVQELEDKQ